MPIFLDQLIQTLQLEQAPASGLAASRPSNGVLVSEIGATATRHGRELAKHGFSVDQAVREYGDVCQAITNLAYDQNISI